MLWAIWKILFWCAFWRHVSERLAGDEEDWI